MRPSLQLRLNQQLAITPQLQQAIRLLQLSSLELEMEVKTALESNFLLEQVDNNDESTQTNDSTPLDDLNNTEAFINQLSTTDYRNNDTLKHQDPPQKNPEITLQHYLIWQMEMNHFSLKERAIAVTLIDAISDEGYLIFSLEEIQKSLDVNLEILEIESVLKKIQKFDPVGVGARTLSECLLLQLNALSPLTPSIDSAKQLANEYLESLGARDFKRLKKKLKLDQTVLDSAVKLLTSLNPKPGNRISSKKNEYIIPDVIAWKKDGRIIVELNREFIPKLRVNANYVDLLKHSNNESCLQAFKNQLKEARWFLKGLKNRYETLLKVTRSIIEQQADFLNEGEIKMKPLSLQNIADMVGLHESTVSRVTTQKYILTPRGVFELKYFFSNPASLHNGEKISAVAIRSIIQKLITQESSQTPLSDHKITESLAEQGIKIARRTVTKYREAIGIPTSNERKRSRFNTK